MAKSAAQLLYGPVLVYFYYRPVTHYAVAEYETPLPTQPLLYLNIV